MHTFKQFLLEAAVDKRPSYEKLEVDAGIKFLNTHCKNALWMLQENRPIYRGDPMGPAWSERIGFVVVDSTKTARKSQNTSNWYTAILDAHPDRQHFPKRSRSFIATTDKIYAQDYILRHSDLSIIIPTDTAKIGLVNDEDMWNTPLKGIPGWRGNIEDFNHVLTQFAKSLFDTPTVTVQELEMLDVQLKKGNGMCIKALVSAMKDFTSISVTQKDIDELSKNFLSIIWNAYSEGSTGHSVVTTATMPHRYDGEVWVGGEVIMISLPMWKQLRQEIKASSS